MQISCSNCGAMLFVDDAQLTHQRSVEVKCWMCTQKVSLRDPSAAEEGPPTLVMSSSAPLEKSTRTRIDASAAPETTSLVLPQNRTIRISVVSGPSRGSEFDLSRPLVTIGRLGGGADFEIDDAEVSRLHCTLEVRDGAIYLHDLSSTNGTFIGEARVFATRLEHLSKFRIGATILQVSVLAAGDPR